MSNNFIQSPIIAKQIGYQFADGETLFSEISGSISHKITALIGNNGCGKSLLASILAGETSPTFGDVSIAASVHFTSQLTDLEQYQHTTIAQFLGIEDKLLALQAITEGSSDPAFFDTLQDDWQLEENVAQRLQSLSLPSDWRMSCELLSGGQLARLKLWQAFQSNNELLILDEPSNHLDVQGKQWLIAQIKQFTGLVLLISHDRELLNIADEIWELSTLGLTVYGGNYDFYAQKKAAEVAATERQLGNVKSEQTRVRKQEQLNREKAQQREAKGNKLRKSGSQSKLILDGMKGSAELSASNRLKNLHLRQRHLDTKEQALSEKLEQIKAQKFHFQSAQMASKALVNAIECELPFAHCAKQTFIVHSSDKLALKGENGAGKTTLLKLILKQISPVSGELSINTPTFYLDQHFGFLEPQKTALESIVDNCDGVLQEQARTLLAGIGFRRESVHRRVEQLSGGEKMKLSMLIVTHQPNSPLLLLDEPDNHLDLSSKQLLAQALFNYQGAFLLVSHDSHFVEECGLTGELGL